MAAECKIGGIHPKIEKWCSRVWTSSQDVYHLSYTPLPSGPAEGLLRSISSIEHIPHACHASAVLVPLCCSACLYQASCTQAHCLQWAQSMAWLHWLAKDVQAYQSQVFCRFWQIGWCIDCGDFRADDKNNRHTSWSLYCMHVGKL